MPEADLALECRGVMAGYGEALILHGIDITVPVGRIVTVIGPNGSGKSTLLKTIVGVVTHKAGSSMLRTRSGEHRDITRLRAYQLGALGLSYVPQLANVFADMSVLENLQIGAMPIAGAAERRRRIEAVLEQFPVLRRRLAHRAGMLSGGQRQVLAIARALVPDPTLIVLDEPSAGIQPDLVDAIFEDIVRLSRAGLSVLLVEQKARQALEFSDYAYVLEMGRKRFEGTGPALAADPVVIDLYLGAGGLPPAHDRPPDSDETHAGH